MRFIGSRIALVAIAIALTCLPSIAEEPLRIGIGAPLTGIDSVFGSQLRLGVVEAVADINADGGFLGRPAKVVLGDDAGDAKKGIEIAKRFVGSGIKLVVGHFSSAVTMSTSAIYAEAKVLNITPTAEAPQVTERGFTTIFRMCGREDQQAAVAARFVVDRHFAKVAILFDRSATGKPLADGVRKALAERGIGTTYYGGFNEGAKELGGIVSRIKAAGTQIVFWGGGPQGAAQLARLLRDTRISLLGGIAMASDDFASVAGPAADGAFIVFPQDPRTRPAGAALLDRFKAKNVDPDGYTFYAYAAVQVIRQAAEAARSLEPGALATVMHSGKTFDTVLGPITFNAKGDPNVSDLTVYVWHKGPSGRMEFLNPANT